MPLLGGLAILAGAIVAFLLMFSALPISLLAPPVAGTVIASMIVATVGLIDDRRHLPAPVKLGGQFLAFLVLVYAGIRVNLPIPDPINYLITFMWLAGISNAMNFMDNMDGLTAGVSAVASSFILLLAALNGQHLVAALSAATFGACLGFLRYNLYPAKIFMGDAGSLFLGFILAVLALLLRFPDNVTFVTWMVPVLILALPILDTTLVIISRIRRRVNPFTTAGKDHLSHRLVIMGYSQREAVLALFLVAGSFGMVGLFITGADVIEGYVLGISTALICLFAIWRLEKRQDWQAIRSSQGNKTVL
jgi:UDP-GlcNAc:undecaprenyl-phosphate GlcNAc-1-phosphate transferase